MENKGMRILQWTILLLVLCNIGLIITIWCRPHPGGPPPGESTRDYIVRSLKFSGEQTQKYDALVKEHQQGMKKLRHDAVEYRSLFFAGLKNAQPANVTDSISRLIGNTQQEIEKLTFNHFAQVRVLCTDAQKQEFDNIIADVLKRMGGHHRPPPPGDGPPPGPGGPPPGEDGPPPPDGPQNH